MDPNNILIGAGTLVVDGETDVATVTDAEALSGQKVVPVTDTTGLTGGDVVRIDSGALAEFGTIDTVDPGVSITLVDNLTYSHPTGVDVVEWGTGAVQVGWTRGGVTITPESDHYFVDNIDQVVGTVKAKQVTFNLTISTELSEATLENLRVAWDIPHVITTPAGHKKISIGGSIAGGVSGAVTERGLQFYGIAPSGFQRKFVLNKVVAIDYGAPVMQKGEETVIPVTFRAILDFSDTVTYPNGYYGEFDDNTS